MFPINLTTKIWEITFIDYLTDQILFETELENPIKYDSFRKFNIGNISYLNYKSTMYPNFTQTIYLMDLLKYCSHMAKIIPKEFFSVLRWQ